MLGMVSYFFPQQGFQISENINIRFMPLSDLFLHDTIQYADIAKILEDSKSMNDSVANIIKKDSLKTINDSIKKDSVKAFKYKCRIINLSAQNEFNIDSLRLAIQKMEFPDDNLHLLYPFFREISNIGNTGNPVRILHYGDSQIEGDRISSILRNRLQFYFGGSGVGLVPAVVDNFNSMSIRHSSSANWNIYKGFGPQQRYAGNKRYGALLNFTKYNLTNYSDSTKTQGWVTLKRSNISYESVKNFKQCRLLCGYNSKPIEVDVFSKDKLVKSERLEANKILNILRFHFDETPEEISFKFKGFDSPEIYGIAFDDEQGIAVDNIPLRGSSGLEFTKIDQDFLKTMYTEMNVKMLILQFGVNVVPNVTSNYNFYENALYNQLVTLKKLCPDISIIIVSLSDMSRKEKGAYVSYPNVELIRDAQKNAAFRAGCAFWDMYKAMGGKNSMPSWVFAKPQLARTDFTHFTPAGAKVVADMFYNALVIEYLDYIKNNSNSDQADNFSK